MQKRPVHVLFHATEQIMFVLIISFVKFNRIIFYRKKVISIKMIPVLKSNPVLSSLNKP